MKTLGHDKYETFIVQMNAAEYTALQGLRRVAGDKQPTSPLSYDLEPAIQAVIRFVQFKDAVAAIERVLEKLREIAA